MLIKSTLPQQQLPKRKGGKKEGDAGEGGRKERREAGSQEDKRHATTLMNLKIVMLSERSQSLPKDT